jgi:hypothetical protein
VLLPESAEATAAHLRAQQARLVAAAGRELEAVASAVLGERFDSLLRLQAKGEERAHFLLKDTRGGEATLWVDALPMESDVIARTVTNTTSDNYVVQISDRLPSEHLARVLAHEVGELMAVRDRSGQGLAPVRESLLSRGAEIGGSGELSSEDHGRIGVLNWHAARALDARLPEQRRAEARAELSALIDSCGMRPLAAESEADGFRAEMRAAQVRRLVSREFLSVDAKHLRGGPLAPGPR